MSKVRVLDVTPDFSSASVFDVQVFTPIGWQSRQKFYTPYNHASHDEAREHAISVAKKFHVGELVVYESG